jgi:pimeloyl-ACP methyl ester carboxylesterase
MRPIVTPWLSFGAKDDTLVVMREIDLPDGRLAFVEKGVGPALVLLHGGGVDHRMWSPQLASLPADHRVIAYDARGHGRSSTPTGPFRHADDVVGLLDQLGIERAVLVGTSMGAATAVDTAVEYPERVAAVLACGAGGGDPRFRDPWQLAVLAQRDAARTPEAWITASLRFAAGPSRSVDELDPALVESLREQMGETLTRHVATGVPMLPAEVPDVLTRRAEITVPVLAVGGALDSADHLRVARELADATPRGRFALVEGAAHYPNLECPKEFDALVRSLVGDPGRFDRRS